MSGIPVEELEQAARDVCDQWEAWPDECKDTCPSALEEAIDKLYDLIDVGD
jgi:hypothetical protein